MDRTECVVGVALALFSVAALGCGPDFQSMCEEQEACRGGNDKDVEACVAYQEGYAAFMDDIGCADEFEAFLACVEPLLECQTQPTGEPCSTANECSGDSVCSGGMCVASFYGQKDPESDACKAETTAFKRCD